MAGTPSGADLVPKPRSPQITAPVGRQSYTPLFHAQHDGRYLRRGLIRDYQARYGCRFAVMIDIINPEGVTLFGELVHGADPDLDLHLLLRSAGGDAHSAVRLIRMAQASCQRLVVVVPDIAKSAATILALGAHQIVMGPSSDLGPIDPQVLVGDKGYVSAKEIISAVDHALDDIARRQATHPLHAALLGMGNVDATIYEFAKAALNGTAEIARQACGSNPDRTSAEVDDLVKRVQDSLITGKQLHSAVIGAAEAREVGLPITELQLQADWWQDVWQIWTRYFTIGALDAIAVYESEQASQILQYMPHPQEPSAQ